MLFTKIKNSKVIFPDRKKYRINYSDELMDLVLLLLNKDKTQRLGTKSEDEEVLAHPFFSSLDLKSLEARTMKPPFIPKQEGNSTKFFNTESDSNALKDTYIPRA
jgi:serine/threonine protein kinase